MKRFPRNHIMILFPYLPSESFYLEIRFKKKARSFSAITSTLAVSLKFPVRCKSNNSSFYRFDPIRGLNSNNKIIKRAVH